jgi:zinc transporter ZupT
MVIILAALTFVSTLLGGLFSLRYKNRMHLILGFTAGVLLGLVAFDLLPEIIRLIQATNTPSVSPMIALVVGFLLFHILEKWVVIHHSHDGHYVDHRHPHVGILSALALSGHSFLDGVGIGLAFQVSPAIGILVAIAVIAHDFSDGINTVSLMLVNKNSPEKAKAFLFVDAIAPIIGAFSTLFFKLSESNLLLYLGFFAGFLLYIGAADILPEAHSQQSGWKTIAMTVIGVIFIFIVTRLL